MQTRSQEVVWSSSMGKRAELRNALKSSVKVCLWMLSKRNIWTARTGDSFFLGHPQGELRNKPLDLLGRCFAFITTINTIDNSPRWTEVARRTLHSQAKVLSASWTCPVHGRAFWEWVGRGSQRGLRHSQFSRLFTCRRGGREGGGARWWLRVWLENIQGESCENESFSQKV